jgi:hypothetical protein
MARMQMNLRPMHFPCKMSNLAMNFHAQEILVKTQNKSEGKTVGLRVGHHFTLRFILSFSIEISRA